MTVVCRFSLPSNSAREMPVTSCSTRRANSSMSRRRLRSAGSDVVIDCLGQTIVSDPAVDGVKLNEVDFADAKNRRKLVWDRTEHFPSEIVVVEFHQNVDVAPLRVEIVANERSEKRQPFDMPLAAKLRDLLMRDRHRGTAARRL